MKSFFSLLITLSLLLSQVAAQPFTSHKLTAAEIGSNKKIPEVKDVFTSLSAAQKTKAKDRGDAMTAIILKAILHRADPVKYPMDVQTESVEKSVWKIVEKIPVNIFDSISIKAKATFSDASKKTGLLGKFKDLNFQDASILEAIKVKSNVDFYKKPVIESVKDQPKAQQVNNSKIDINIRSVDCIARTTLANPYDWMVLSGLLVGASGNTNDANSVVTCELIDGLSCDMGGYRFGTYSLGATSTYPKSFYCIFLLVRSAREDQSVTRNIIDAIMSLITPEMINMEDGLDGMAAAVTQCLSNFGGSSIYGDRPLRPYGVKFEMNNAGMSSMNNGATSDFQTGDIHEIGWPDRWGNYRIRYFWQYRQ
jgi:hypothetical protein